MADITMPQLGETVTEGTITKWFKKVGDAVAEDEVIFEVSTDKVDSEVPSPAAGVLAEILVQEGETVDVGTKLAVISAEGGAPAAEAEAPAEEAEAPAEEPAAEEEPAGEEEPAAEEEPAVEAEPAAEAEPEADAEPAPAPKAEKPEPAPKAEEPAPKPAATAEGGTDGKLLSPVVRRLISENNLDPSTIKGTGAGGRITRNDVLAVIEKAPAPAAAPAAKAAPAAPAAEAAPAAPSRPAPAVAATPGQGDTVVPFSNIRKRTAEHMVRSKATSAHVMASIEVDYEGIDIVRGAQRDAWKAAEGFSLTYLPFVSRAVVDAIREFPEVNASVGDNELIIHNEINLGIAVDLDFKGLMVPVVRQADSKRLRAIAREISDLATRARSKKLGPDEIAGGTFTLTNPGPYGTLLTMPIINQPQVAILSTDGVRRRPVVIKLPDGGEGIGIHSVGNLALTWDHRAFDGAYSAAFLARIKELIETRDWAAEL